MEKLRLFLILVILLALLQTTTNTAIVIGQPKWARKGVYLAYYWELWEYVPMEEIESIIEAMKSRAGPGIILNLTDFDENKGYFIIKVLQFEIVAEYCWEEGIFRRIDDKTPLGFPSIYKPLSKLIELPVVEAKIPLGTFHAYEEKIQNTSIKFHKDTGVLLEIVGIQGPMMLGCERENTTCWDVFLIVLVDTNIPMVRRPVVIQKEIQYEGESKQVIVETPSTLEDFSFDEISREIRFIVSGKSGEPGFCNVTLPKRLVGEVSGIEVYFDDQPIKFELRENLTHCAIYFEYVHSAHKVVIKLPPTVPEAVPSVAASPAFPVQVLTIAVVFAAIVAIGLFTLMKRVKQKQTKS